MSDNENIGIYVLGNQVTQGDFREWGGQTVTVKTNISIYLLDNQVTQGHFT